MLRILYFRSPVLAMAYRARQRRQCWFTFSWLPGECSVLWDGASTPLVGRRQRGRDRGATWRVVQRPLLLRHLARWRVRFADAQRRLERRRTATVGTPRRRCPF